MNIVGIVAEYNPFHNGHLYHIQQAKKISNADFVIVIMSGDFVQRGTPAFIDKFSRTEMALNCGADLVIELPISFSTASAELFSFGAVSLLHKSHIVDSLCFGSESGNIKDLDTVAKILTREPPFFKRTLQHYLRKGLPFPNARERALTDYIQHSDELKSDIPLSTILSSPNNILGIEYCKALLKLDSHIRPFTIGRMDKGYHSEDLGTVYSSATSIRKHISDSNSISDLVNHVPESVFLTLSEHLSFSHGQAPIQLNDFSDILYYKLSSLSDKNYSSFSDVSESLSNKIKNELSSFTTYDDFCNCLKTRDITHSRVQRALLHILLDITNDVIKESISGHYIKILGIKKDALPLLSKLKQKSDLPVIFNLAKDAFVLSEKSRRHLELDLFASNIYQKILYNKWSYPLYNEFTQRPLILK